MQTVANVVRERQIVVRIKRPSHVQRKKWIQERSIVIAIKYFTKKCFSLPSFHFHLILEKRNTKQHQHEQRNKRRVRIHQRFDVRDVP